MNIKNEIWQEKAFEPRTLPLKAFGQRFWIALSLLTIGAITIAAIFWIFAHPYATNWDEARYINRAYRDVAFFQKGGIGELLKVIIDESRSRPPAYRLLALPITLTIGVNPTIVRMISLGCLWITLGFIYLAGKRIAGSTAGAFAAIFLAICPITIAGNMRFYVDYPLYLAIAALLYFLFLEWNSEQENPLSWIGFGLALGLGGLAKPPILFIAGPIMLLTLILSWRKIIANPKITWLVKASVLALIINLPWWIFNFKPALAKAFLSGGYVRHSLGEKGSIAALANWLYAFSQSVIGPALTFLVLAIIATFVIKLLRKQLQIETTTATAIAVCLAGSLPMLSLSAYGTNQNLRLVAPALLPLAVAIGIIAALTSWTSSKSLAAIATAVISFQLVVMVTPIPGEPRYQTGDAASNGLIWGNPTTVMRRVEQWDWSQLREICKARKIESPLIAYLGNLSSFNPPQIAFPWVKANEEVKVAWLWQYTFGEINWNKVMEAVKSSDVILTAPGLIGSSSDRQDLDNRHNAEFVRRMQNLPEFSEPIKLMMKRFNPVEVFVYLRKQPRTSNSTPAIKTLDIV